MTDLRQRAVRALHEHAHRTEGGKWSFGGYSHSEADALAIVEACLILDVPVTDILTSAAWLKLIAKVASLQARLDRLEAS